MRHSVKTRPRTGFLHACALLIGLLPSCADESDEYWGGTVGGYQTPLLALDFVQDENERRLITNAAGIIHNRGPFDHFEDGQVYPNAAGLLPAQHPRYYRSYTVPTPNVKGRGRRRLVAGDAGELYYSRDNMNSFTEVRVIPR